MAHADSHSSREDASLEPVSARPRLHVATQARLSAPPRPLCRKSQNRKCTTLGSVVHPNNNQVRSPSGKLTVLPLLSYRASPQESHTQSTVEKVVATSRKDQPDLEAVRQPPCEGGTLGGSSRDHANDRACLNSQTLHQLQTLCGGRMDAIS